MIVKILVFVTVTVAASAVNQEDEVGLMTILAKERKELTEERKEIGEIFRGETERLRKEDEELRGKLDKLQGKLDEQHEKNEKLRQKDNHKLEKLQGQNEEQQAQIVKLQKENQELRRANSKINKVIRQRDPNNTRELDARIKNSLRQNDLSSELKKMMRAEIKNYLIEEHICVSGSTSFSYGGILRRRTIDFGYKFPRNPTVSASLNYIFNVGGGAGAGQVQVYVSSVSKSSAVILMDLKMGANKLGGSFAWLACL